MTDDQRRGYERLDERSQAHGNRIDKLEQNQKWVIITVIGGVLKLAMDYFGKSGGQ